jgi:hypothetical protein
MPSPRVAPEHAAAGVHDDALVAVPFESGHGRSMRGN